MADAAARTADPTREEGLSHRDVQAGDVRLHCVEAGAGPPVVLLHGFPEFWYSWRHQLPALAAAGYHAVAPDMRGYDRSEKPPGVGSYRPDLLARDVAELIRALGSERAVVVGHDWGGAVAWHFAMRHPDLLERLVILDAPHPERMARALRTFSQLRRSWYMLFFQLPWLPEAVLGARDFGLIRRTFRHDPVRPGALSEEDIDRYVEALSQPGARTGALNYYRAAFRDPRQALARPPRIDHPVLLIWGGKDAYVPPELALPDTELVPNARVEVIPEASHWVQNDQPERVNARLLDFLAPIRA